MLRERGIWNVRDLVMGERKNRRMKEESTFRADRDDAILIRKNVYSTVLPSSCPKQRTNIVIDFAAHCAALDSKSGFSDKPVVTLTSPSLALQHMRRVTPLQIRDKSMAHAMRDGRSPQISFLAPNKR